MRDIPFEEQQEKNAKLLKEYEEKSKINKKEDNKFKKKFEKLINKYNNEKDYDKSELLLEEIDDKKEELYDYLDAIIGVYRKKKIFYTVDEEKKIKKDIKHWKILSKSDIPLPNHQKSFSKPSISVSETSKTVSKTSTEDLEKQLEEIKGSLKPKHKKLIKQIPDDTYSKRNILQIILNIYNDHYKSSKDFPEPKEGQTADLSDVIEFKKPSSNENSEIETIKDKPLQLVKKRGRKPLDKDKKAEKEKEKKEKEKAKEEKKKEKAKIYYGSSDLPTKYHRRPTMEEAVKAKQVAYWGLKKVDSKALTMLGDDEKRKKDEIELSKKLASETVNFVKLKTLYNNKKSKNEDVKTIEPKLENSKKLILEIQNKIKKIKGKGLYTSSTDDDYDSDEFEV